MNDKLPNHANQKGPSSHVTNTPQTAPGDNFDPQIRTQYANEPHVVHASRNPEGANLSVSADNQRRHEDSVKQYPRLNLSEGEYVILDVKRHPIGLLLPLIATGITLIALIAVLILYPADTSSYGVGLPSFGQILLPVLLLMILTGIGGGIVSWVYLQNQFYMTNESVIQEIQHSLFSRHEQTVSLGSIEDASFKKSGILQTMLDYGMVRLSTEGEETTYRFTYVANPRRHVAILNNAVEAFKNGRPVPVDPYET
jgi:uncharacterized membrane protein YdbT with pleckstrin-like domain